MLRPYALAPEQLRVLDRVARVSTLLTPLLLLHAHGIAEASVAIAGLCFLMRSASTGDWAWLRAAWVRLALGWWAWMVFCSLPIPALGLGEGGTHSLIQGLAAIRFPIFAAALEFCVLRDPVPRRWMFGLIAASAIYISANIVLQFTFGRNMYGVRPLSGALLTGPFNTARASPALARLLPPVLIAIAEWLPRRVRYGHLWAYAVLLGGMSVLVMVGQRIPVLLAGGALIVAALLIKRLRPMVLAAFVAVGVLISGLAVISPLTYQRLVTQTEMLLSEFPTNPYGQLFTRALEIGRQQPLTGLGFDGFRDGCAQPRYFRPSFDGKLADGGGATLCWVHPHNFYLQALVDGGVIGLALFCALEVAWLIPLGRGLWHNPDPLRVGLFATILAQLVPLQSTSSYWSMPMGGWFYLLVGWALAEARWRDAGG